MAYFQYQVLKTAGGGSQRYYARWRRWIFWHKYGSPAPSPGGLGLFKTHFFDTKREAQDAIIRYLRSRQQPLKLKPVVVAEGYIEADGTETDGLTDDPGP